MILYYINMEKKKISIAIQSHGSFSAFAWGCLDMILQDERFEITGLSSSGTGGILSAAAIQGLSIGGSKHASDTLRELWLMFSSIYQENELDISQKLGKFFDFTAIHQSKQKLYIGCTPIDSGKIAIFSNKKITPEIISISFLDPHRSSPIGIEEQLFWNGEISANPSINPLIGGVENSDIIVIQLFGLHELQNIHNQIEIDSRINQIRANSQLMREMRAIYLITKLIDSGKISKGSLKRIHMHLITNNNNMVFGDKDNYNWKTVTSLYNDGYSCTKNWISNNFDKIGIQNSGIDSHVFECFL